MKLYPIGRFFLNGDRHAFTLESPIDIDDFDYDSWGEVNRIVTDETSVVFFLSEDGTRDLLIVGAKDDTYYGVRTRENS